MLERAAHIVACVHTQHIVQGGVRVFILGVKVNSTDRQQCLAGLSGSWSGKSR